MSHENLLGLPAEDHREFFNTDWHEVVLAG
jgi:hypothetical protein